LQALFGGLSLIGGYHLDKAEPTRLLGMWIKHDRAVFDVTVLLEQAGDIGFGETWVNPSDEEIRAGIDGFIIRIHIFHAGVGGRWRRSVASIGRPAAVAFFSIPTRRGRSVATLIATIIFIASSRFVEVGHDVRLMLFKGVVR